MADFLHDRRDFDQLLAIVANDRALDPMLVEKDYWIMHSLWGLQAQGFEFELKGGTSLSKGFGVIHRFSEDIDIRIEPPADMNVKTGRNQDKPAHIDSRRAYYDELSKRIRIPGIDSVERDTLFDDDKMRSAGIRLAYTPRATTVVDACQTGFRPMIVREAVGDRSEAAHAQSLFDMDAKYGDVVTLEDTLHYLRQLPVCAD